MSSDTDIYEDNDYELDFTVQRRNDGTGVLEPATGLTTLYGWLAATEGGAEIHADVKKLMVERSGNPGDYFAVVDGDKITLHLFGTPNYDGLAVYIIAADTGQNLRVFKKRKAHATRQAT
jgi:hypothetical protein